MTSELLPCRECGRECSLQEFEGSLATGTLWLCGAHSYLGGDCPSTTAYLAEEAWNTRASLTEQPRDGLAGELARLIEATRNEDGLTGMRLADQELARFVRDNDAAIIAALSRPDAATVERWFNSLSDVVLRHITDSYSTGQARERMLRALRTGAGAWRTCPHGSTGACSVCGDMG